MKSGTEAKLKFKTLQDELGQPGKPLELWKTRGLLDALWWFVSNNCPAGNIGKFTDEQIAIGIEWREDAQTLILALTKHGWLDASDAHRLIVHDWPEHCEDSIHIALARKKLYFADGSTPKLTRLSKDERADIEAFYKSTPKRTHKKRTAHAQETHGVRTQNALPNPALPVPDLALPSPATKNAQGVFSKLEPADLQDTPKLMAWQQDAAKRKKPVVSATAADSMFVLAAAELGITDGERPVGLFAQTILDRRHDWLRAEHKDRGDARYRDFVRGRDGPPANHLRDSILKKHKPEANP